MPVANLDGTEVFYEDTEGDRPALVFSHGLLMDHEMFADQVDAFKLSYRCIAWDERGHGRTKSGGPFTYWDSATDLLALLDHLGLETAFLVGMSQGGFLSLRAALSAPDRVSGLVLIDTQAGTEDPSVVPVYLSMLDRWEAEGLQDNVADAIASIIIGSDVDAQPWVQKWRAWPTDELRPGYGALIDREDIHDRLSDIMCPALVIHGTADAAISTDKAERLCRELGNCVDFVAIEGASHAANMSHPDEVNTAMRSFLQRYAG